MHIENIYVYPIKSIRGCSLRTAKLTPHGFPYDRIFMLLKDHKDASKSSTGERYQNMAISKFPDLGLFTTEMTLPSSVVATSGELRVTHRNPKDDSTRHLTIPLEPDISDLHRFEVNMHSSPTTGYTMPAEYTDWFSSCLGYDVVLVYIGTSSRLVLGNLSPNASTRNPARIRAQQSTTASLFSSLTSTLPSFLGGAADNSDATLDYTIRFSDVSPYLIVSSASLADVSARLPEGEAMDVRKFRPNLIVAGASAAWDEDFWAALGVAGATFSLTANCGRCASINVDYDTGAFGAGAAGEVLKRLQSDRRVDAGAKYSPVFGRYGFLTPRGLPDRPGGAWVSVGDEVVVEQRNEERTVFKWPGIGQTKKGDLFPV